MFFRESRLKKEIRFVFPNIDGIEVKTDCRKIFLGKLVSKKSSIYFGCEKIRLSAKILIRVFKIFKGTF
ncbi:hypothetical protein DQM68_10700 [Leptospira mayottensis]|uniref:Uncharacterized protein n=1 Tax=Leptospira mayottensis TaxID=1137606 RepID=A0ABN5NUP5_9LEPT|nr:hypothetical protein DQM68_10700 [Leptospira mayottensis]AXR65663.1 hypothetical protein DQM28_17030 [Leptospira mayottensis]AZQ02482.1 hypothetical protein LEP1GSC190_10995 [Leptospira mayottensis 200901116]